MQISIFMPIFLLFSDQISGGQEPLRGATCLRERPPCGRKPAVPWGMFSTVGDMSPDMYHNIFVNTEHEKCEGTEHPPW